MCGMGNVGIACLLEGLNYIGIESNDEFAELANQKLLKYYCDGVVRCDTTKMKIVGLEAEELYSLINPPRTDDGTSELVSGFEAQVFHCSECGLENIGLTWAGQFDSRRRYYCNVCCRRHSEYLMLVVQRTRTLTVPTSNSDSGSGSSNSSKSSNSNSSFSLSSRSDKDEVLDEHGLEEVKVDCQTTTILGKKHPRRHTKAVNTNRISQTDSDHEQQPFKLTSCYPGYLSTVPIGMDPQVSDWKTNLSKWPQSLSQPEQFRLIKEQISHWGNKIEVRKSGSNLRILTKTCTHTHQICSIVRGNTM
jgi:hypothetical protein